MKKLPFLIIFAFLFSCVPPVARAGTSNVTVNNLTGALNMGQMGAGVNKGFVVPSAYSIEFLSGSTLKVNAGATVNGLPSVAGNNTELQFNNTGSFAGTTGLTWGGQALNNTKTLNFDAELFAVQNASAGTSAVAETQISNDVTSLVFKLTGSNFSGALIAGGPSGQSSAIFTATNVPISVGVNATQVALFTTTGLNDAAIGATTPRTAVVTSINARTLSAAPAMSSSTIQGSGGSYATVVSLPAGWGTIHIVAEENGTTNTGYYKVDFVNGTGIAISGTPSSVTVGATTGQLTFQLSGANLQAKGANVTPPNIVKYWIENFAF